MTAIIFQGWKHGFGMSPFERTLPWHSIQTCLRVIRRQKGRKPVKYTQKSVITPKSVVNMSEYVSLKHICFGGECPGKFATFVHKHACLLPVLHAVKVALAIFYQQKQIFTGIYLYNPLYKGMASPGKMLPLTSFCVAVRLQPSPCLNFDSFQSFYAYKLTMYQHPQQKNKKCTY